MMVDTKEKFPTMVDATAARGAGGSVPEAAAAPAATTAQGGRRIKGEVGGAPRTKLTMLQVTRQIYGESGILGFYRGFYVSILQFAPTSAVRAVIDGVMNKSFAASSFLLDL